MKQIKFLACLLVTAVTFSCSSDSDSNDSTPPQTVDPNEYFTYSNAGTDVPIATWTAIRAEDEFEILGQAPDGSSMYLNFHDNGVLVRAGNTPANDSDIPWRNSAYDFSSNYFDFHLVAIDTANKIVKVTYSGKLYDDDFDLTSATAMVSGTVNVHYIDMAPTVPGLRLSAKIGGNDWLGVKSYLSNNGDISNIIMSYNSNDKNQISLYFNDTDTGVGTYDFNEDSLNNKVTLSVYNPTTREYLEYDCVGTFKIDEKTNTFGTTLMRGTFSFTATNPDDNSTIQVSDGAFKTVYNW